MSEDAGGGFGNLDDDPSTPEPAGFFNRLGESEDSDDLLVGCACGEKPKCFYLDPSDCARAKAQKAQLSEEHDEPNQPLREAAARARQDVGGVWVTCREDYSSPNTSYLSVVVHASELDALRAVNATDQGDRARFIKFGESL